MLTPDTSRTEEESSLNIQITSACVWSKSLVTNEDDTYPLNIPLHTGSPNYGYVSSESGPSFLFQRDHEEALLTPRNVEIGQKTIKLNLNETVSICSSEELKKFFRNCDISRISIHKQNTLATCR